MAQMSRPQQYVMVLPACGLSLPQTTRPPFPSLERGWVQNSVKPLGVERSPVTVSPWLSGFNLDFYIYL